ncbi:hypothetical protein [Nocardiopsis alborubida]|uniref:hypothetical protein n=1 Tax=Nocardiopsis alborubida TaxID=146802 RepID=UPI00076E3E79|nr:hypothetical protein [Nocardiopsis alborubida]
MGASPTEPIERTGASEVLVNVSTYDPDEARRTDESLASLQAPERIEAGPYVRPDTGGAHVRQ